MSFQSTNAHHKVSEINVFGSKKYINHFYARSLLTHKLLGMKN